VLARLPRPTPGAVVGKRFLLKEELTAQGWSATLYILSSQGNLVPDVFQRLSSLIQ
jgi:hypothetical protein